MATCLRIIRDRLKAVPYTYSIHTWLVLDRPRVAT
jgi:hypothetical protein